MSTLATPALRSDAKRGRAPKRKNAPIKTAVEREGITPNLRPAGGDHSSNRGSDGKTTGNRHGSTWPRCAVDTRLELTHRSTRTAKRSVDGVRNIPIPV